MLTREVVDGHRHHHPNRHAVGISRLAEYERDGDDNRQRGGAALPSASSAVHVQIDPSPPCFCSVSQILVLASDERPNLIALKTGSLRTWPDGSATRPN